MDLGKFWPHQRMGRTMAQNKVRSSFLGHFPHFVKKKASAEIRWGIFPTESPVNFVVIFWWFLGPFPWNKREEKLHPKIHSKIQIRVWGGQSPGFAPIYVWGRNPFLGHFSPGSGPKSIFSQARKLSSLSDWDVHRRPPPLPACRLCANWRLPSSMRTVKVANHRIRTPNPTLPKELFGEIERERQGERCRERERETERKRERERERDSEREREREREKKKKEREREIYIYMLWCYYLGQVWPFEVLLSGPSLFFTKHCLSKKHYKNRGFSTFCFEKKLRAQIWGVIIWAKLVIFKMQSTWPR